MKRTAFLAMLVLLIAMMVACAGVKEETPSPTPAAAQLSVAAFGASHGEQTG